MRLPPPREPGGGGGLQAGKGACIGCASIMTPGGRLAWSQANIHMWGARGEQCGSGRLGGRGGGGGAGGLGRGKGLSR